MTLGPNAIHTATGAVAVTPNDSTVLQDGVRALWVGGTGDVAVQTHGGQSVIFSGVVGGCIIPVQVTKVLATGTTATAILALL